MHVLSDSIVKLAQIRGLLGDACDMTTELLTSTKTGNPRCDAVIAAIDIRRPGSIAALKHMADDLASVPKRIFLLDQAAF